MSPKKPKTTVVMVHGALVNGWEMGLLRRRLRLQGYQVRQFYYPSRWRGLEENTERLRQFLAEAPGEVLHVVAHSMGAVLTRRIFESTPDPRPGRIVAIGPPFLGCLTGRRVGALHARAHWLIGKTVRDYVAIESDPVWRGTREIGVIAGTFPLGAGSLLRGLPRPNDGVVLLSETKLKGISGHITYRLSHSGLLASRRCARQIGYFLENGRFALENLGGAAEDAEPNYQMDQISKEVP